jgi:hypothetical protein
MNKQTLIDYFSSNNIELEHNKYLDIYISMINAVPSDKGEVHHKIPKSFGGTNDPSNLIKLGFRQHYLVHQCLARFLKGEAKAKMFFALNRFVGSDGHSYISSRKAEVIRRKMAACLVGRTHFTNLETGEIKFVHESPGQDWILGNLHGKKSYVDPTLTQMIWCLPDEKPDGWTAGCINKNGNVGYMWFYDETTKEYLFSKEEQIGLIRRAPAYGKRTFRHRDTGKVIRSESAPPEFDPWSPILGKLMIHNIESGVMKFVDAKESLPAGWNYGQLPGTVSSGWNFVTLRGTGVIKKLENKQDFDPESMDWGFSESECRIFAYDPITLEARKFKSIEYIPGGWIHGNYWIKPGFKIAHNKTTGQIIHVDSHESLPVDFEYGRGLRRVWITRNNKELLIDEALFLDEMSQPGTISGRATMKNNRLNAGKSHCHNPSTGENMMLPRGSVLPVGWQWGAVWMKRESTVKGKSVYTNESGDIRYFKSDEEIPVGWVRGNLKLKKYHASKI